MFDLSRGFRGRMTIGPLTQALDREGEAVREIGRRIPVSTGLRLLARYAGRFEDKVFTDGERAYCRGRAHRAEHFAARWAAKEATLKALGVPEGLSWPELEVVSTEGRPTLALHGAAAQAMAAMGVSRLHLSLTHAGGQAAAVVIAEGP